MPDKPIIVCMKLSVLPVPPVESEINYCDDCDEKVWTDITLQAAVEVEHPGVKPGHVCMECMKKRIEE